MQEHRNFVFCLLIYYSWEEAPWPKQLRGEFIRSSGFGGLVHDHVGEQSSRLAGTVLELRAHTW